MDVMEAYRRTYTREDLEDLFLKDLKFYGSKFLSVDRYAWLSHIKEADLKKLLVYDGYLMAMKDMGNNVGDMKLILEFIIKKETH